MKHGARGKKQTLKSASTDLGTTDVGELQNIYQSYCYILLQVLLYTLTRGCVFQTAADKECLVI